jgi:hypothetical protein
MEKFKAVIVDAEVCKISDLFHKKPPGLRFNETDAFVVSARSEDGKDARTTFYLSLKADGTFDEDPMGSSTVKARRHKLATFLRYYGLTDDVRSFKLKEKVNDMKGLEVEAVSTNGEATIYVP